MQGWESYIRVQENVPGWGSQALYNNASIPGWFLEIDDESLSMNPIERDRAGKIVGKRISEAPDYTIEGFNPSGGLTAQPHLDDLFPFLMAHFQCIDFNGTNTGGTGEWFGTLTFVPLEDTADWSGSLAGTLQHGTDGLSGTVVASDMYCLNIDKYFGAKESDAYANGERYQRGFVDTLEINQPMGEDLVFSPTMKFRDVDGTFSYPAGYVIPSSYGSLSALSKVVSWMGTVTVKSDGTSVTTPLDAINFTFNNQTSDDGPFIGEKSYTRFSFGKWIGEGSFDAEMERVDWFRPGQIGNIDAVFFNSTTEWLRIFAEEIKYTPFDRSISGPEKLNYTYPFRMFGSSSAGTPAVVVQLCATMGSAAYGLIHYLL